MTTDFQAMGPSGNHPDIEDVAARFLRSAAFMGFGQEKARLVADSRNLLLPMAPALVDALYDHLLRYSETARFFADAAGRPDLAFLAKRKETLSQWLAASLNVRLDSRFADYIYQVGVAHRRAGVPSQYLTATMGFTQAAIGELLAEAMHPDMALPTIEAWNKLLMLQLDLLLASYEPGGLD